MNNSKIIISTLCLSILLSACSNSKKDYDASGSFEAVERIISSKATGTILSLNIEEGNTLKPNDTIGNIDVTHLILQSEQIKASINAIGSKTNDATPQVQILIAQKSAHKGQIASIEQQSIVLDKEIKRFEELVKLDAVPQKQLDDLKGQKSILQKQLNAAQIQNDVIDQQINAAKKNVKIQNRAVLSEIEPAQKKLELVLKQINDGYIVNSHSGTVISKYAYDGEFTNLGKPIYKIADLANIILRAYITGDQLAKIKLNDEVKVFTDDGNGGLKESKGRVEWISDKAEFTPKTIQTKEERANMVYAIKVKLINDGSFKIGMYGEIKFLTDV